MTGSYSAILGGLLAAYLLGFGVGYAFKLARSIIQIAANSE